MQTDISADTDFVKFWNTVLEPKFTKYFAESDLICGDYLYIGKHASHYIALSTQCHIGDGSTAGDGNGSRAVR